MRWRLLIITVLLASLAATVLWLAILFGVHGINGSALRVQPLTLWFIIGGLSAVAVACYSGLFVYRHTARHRRMQALLSIVISLTMTLLLFHLAKHILILYRL
ncbi:MAG: hypothetical protein MSG64_00840 [Pyrinomonadaceae bacterium MAG19_C2-C3]|nr:hypothetical protein [Pyrinomonadaceae bacterium MAG19_C2-C3]